MQCILQYTSKLVIKTIKILILIFQLFEMKNMYFDYFKAKGPVYTTQMFRYISFD